MPVKLYIELLMQSILIHFFVNVCCVFANTSNVFVYCFMEINVLLSYLIIIQIYAVKVLVNFLNFLSKSNESIRCCITLSVELTPFYVIKRIIDEKT